MRATLHYFLLPELGVMKGSQLNLHQWIKSNRFSSAQRIGKCWHLEAYSETELYSTFTPDFQRFSFSSFETFSLARLEAEKCNSTGWPLLKLYYSAFFAAHALTRATGQGQVNLDSSVVESVNDYTAIIGDAGELQTGTYKASIEEENDRVFLRLEPSSEGGGVHDNFWKFFCKYLDGLARSAVKDELPSAGAFLRETDALTSCIRDSNTSGVWFSATRNAINYRHEFDCWLPNDKKSAPRKLIFPSELGDPDAMESTLTDWHNDLARVVQLSTYLASLNHQLILRVQNEISGNESFSRKWKRLNDFLCR